MNALMNAIWDGNYAEVERLLNSGVEVNEIVDGRTALHIAALCHSPDIVRSLLSRGADTSIRNSAGLTPRELALNLVENHSHDATVRETVRLLGGSSWSTRFKALRDVFGRRSATSLDLTHRAVLQARAQQSASMPMTERVWERIVRHFPDRDFTFAELCHLVTESEAEHAIVALKEQGRIEAVRLRTFRVLQRGPTSGDSDAV